MKPYHIKRNLWLACLLLLSSLLINATNTSFLVDVSGSMNGLSNDRTIQSLTKIRNELYNFLKSNKADSIQVITFTDKIIDSFSVIPNSIEIDSIIKIVSYPRKGNTNLASALDCLNTSNVDRIVIMSDGRHNIGSYTDVIKILETERFRKQYFFLLDESDFKTPLIKTIANTNYIKIIRSLSELYDDETLYQDSEPIKVPQTIKPVESSDNHITFKNKSHLNFYNILFWIIIVLLIILCLYFLLKIFPLFTMVSAGAIQKAIFFLYNLPKPIFKIIFKSLPLKMTTFLKEYMPKYEDIKRGEVIPKNDIQKRTLDKWQELTGKRAKYKNGEPDFREVAEHIEKLKGSLDDNIPKGSDPRSDVSKAQDRAANQMLNSKMGRKKIADYVGKKPSDITYNDYTSWKDDALNLGKPNHNPKTPHETIDGKYIMWIPKQFHDVSWGGIDHYGGVSMLKSIRNYFDLNIK